MPEMSAEHQNEVIRAQLISKAVLHPGDETELYELTQLAGVTMDPQVFKILLDLLKMNVPPVAIVQTLRSMCSPHQHSNITSAQSKNVSLGRGEPHPNITYRGDSSHTHHSSSSHVYDSSHSGTANNRGRGGGRERSERNSSRETNRKQNNTDYLDSSNYLSYTTSARDNYSYEQTRPTPDTAYSGYKSRSSEKRSQSPASSADRFVTMRSRNTGTSNEYKERTGKKRSSYQ